jgi:hypothetical protein
LDLSDRIGIGGRILVGGQGDAEGLLASDGLDARSVDECSLAGERDDAGRVTATIGTLADIERVVDLVVGELGLLERGDTPLAANDVRHELLLSCLSEVATVDDDTGVEVPTGPCSPIGPSLPCDPGVPRTRTETDAEAIRKATGSLAET